jgi:RNA polymerase sigma factor (sigma-70 family)
MKSGDDNFAELDELYQEWGPGLIRWLRWQLPSSREVAEDIAQDAFLIMWRNWPRIRSHPNLRGYLYTTARHLMWEVAKERPRVFLQAESPDEAGSEREDDPSEGYSRKLAIEKALEKLPRRQRQAVWLHYICDFKQDQVAKIMQIKRGTVAALLNQARNRLAELLG